MRERSALQSAEFLHECFRYDAQTGALVYKVRPRHHFNSDRAWRIINGRDAGTMAGVSGHGYARVTVNGKRYFAHRVIWKMVYGTEPYHIDHTDRDRANNRLTNLRECEEQQNRFNVGRYRNNKSGFKGVHKFKDKWRAMIRIDGASRHIGLYNSPESAHQAYCAEAERLFGEFAAT